MVTVSNTYSGQPPDRVSTTTRKSAGQLVWSGRRCSGRRATRGRPGRGALGTTGSGLAAPIECRPPGSCTFGQGAASIPAGYRSPLVTVRSTFAAPAPGDLTPFHPGPVAAVASRRRQQPAVGAHLVSADSAASSRSRPTRVVPRGGSWTSGGAERGTLGHQPRPAALGGVTAAGGVSSAIAARTVPRLWQVNSAMRSRSRSGVSAVIRNVGRRSAGVPSTYRRNRTGRSGRDPRSRRGSRAGSGCVPGRRCSPTGRAESGGS